MQERTSGRGQRLALRADPYAPPARGAPIEVVSDDRMAMRRQVNPDLVRPAGLRGQDEVGDGGKARQSPIARASRLAVRANSHPPPVRGIAPDRVVPDTLGRPGMSPDQSPVRLARQLRLERERKGAVRLLRAREEDDAGSALVEAVNQEQTFPLALSAGL